MRPIYLDYNTTTPIAPRVQEAMLPFLAEHFATPDGPGPEAEAVRHAIEDARFRLRVALGATDDHRIIFTSGGTESCQTAIRGVVDNWWKCEYGDACHVVISGVEHGCAAELARHLQQLGRVEVTTVACNASGVVEPEAISAALRTDTALVCVAHADGVTGVVQPIAQIAEACHANRTLLHVDAAVSFGKVPTNVEALGADLLSISGHKVYGPKGVGALYARDTAVLEPMLVGQLTAGDELRPGTPNIPGVVGLGHAAELATTSLSESAPRLAGLRDKLESALRSELGEQLEVFGESSTRLPNTSALRIGGLDTTQLADAAPDLRLPFLIEAVSGWRRREACLGGGADASGVLRLSVGWYTTEEEVDRAASLLIDAWERLRDR